MVFSNGNANDSYELIFTDATEEDGGAEAGWSIGDEGQLSKNGGSWDGIGAVFCIAVRGTISDATLSDLEISAGGSDVPLSPDFSPTVTSYIARIATGANEITVLPTVNYGGATVEYLDVNGAAITDGAAAAGLQFSLSGGNSTIMIRVTSADSNKVVRTYTVLVAPEAQTQTPTEATGKPVITGPAQVGATLTADTDDIADANGLGAFTYRWLRVNPDGTNPRQTGGNSATYRPIAADRENRIRVEVSFRDLVGTRERVVSRSTSVVAPGR